MYFNLHINGIKVDYIIIKSTCLPGMSCVYVSCYCCFKELPQRGAIVAQLLTRS